MIKPKRIFIDTSAWIELTLAKERYHKEVASYFLKELKKGSKFFTSDYVLDEAFTRLLTNQGLSSAKSLREKTSQAEKLNKLLILWTDETVFYQSWNRFVKFSEHQLSFTDATIYTFVKDLKINEIITLDQGFKKVGLTIKPKI